MDVKENLILRKVLPSDEKAFRAAVEEFKDSDFTFAFDFDDNTNFLDYLDSLEDFFHGRNIDRTKFVPSSFLVAVVGDKIVGRSSIRHELNDYLRRIGGHIGYGVVPSERRKGYAEEILRQSVVYAKNIGIQKMLVTCDHDNIGSIRTIEKNGGVYENSIEDKGHPTRRYWIC